MKTIIIVEDEAVNALLLKEMLRSFNVNIIILSNGNGLLEVITQNDAALVLMDVRLPGEDGFSLTTKIKSKYPDLPVIIQTAYAFKTDKEKADKAGCDAYLPKPINKTKLINLINNFIKI